jgi:folate-binding protein YgfZ
MTDIDYSPRAFLRLRGEDRVSFLQGILTQDVTKLEGDKIQFAALLSPQGKILHDMFLLAMDDSILIDTQAGYKDTLLKRLNLYKLRARVAIEEVVHDALTGEGELVLPDPRHPALPARHYFGAALPAASLALGIPELGRDFAPDSLTALDAGHDLLHAVSFTKGCYVGQEVTARMHYKQVARRGFYILEQNGVPMRLAPLRFEDVEAAGGMVTVDNAVYRARLPGWMQPKFEQFIHQRENQ